MTNELKDAIEELLAHVNEAIKLETEWYRHMLSLAAGALALLAGLSPAVPAAAVGRYLLAATWVFLGAGILAGAGATYYGARRVRLRSRDLAKRIDAHVEEGKPLTELVVHKKPVILKLCRPVTWLTLLTAVVCLVGYAVVIALEPATASSPHPASAVDQVPTLS